MGADGSVWKPMERECLSLSSDLRWWQDHGDQDQLEPNHHLTTENGFGKRLAVSLTLSPDLSPLFLNSHTAILEPDFRVGVFPNPIGDGNLSSSFRCHRLSLAP